MGHYALEKGEVMRAIIALVFACNILAWIIVPWGFFIGYPILRYLGVINFHFDMFVWLGVSLPLLLGSAVASRWYLDETG